MRSREHLVWLGTTGHWTLLSVGIKYLLDKTCIIGKHNSYVIAGWKEPSSHHQCLVWSRVAGRIAQMGSQRFWRHWKAPNSVWQTLASRYSSIQQVAYCSSFVKIRGTTIYNSIYFKFFLSNSLFWSDRHFIYFCIPHTWHCKFHLAAIQSAPLSALTTTPRATSAAWRSCTTRGTCSGPRPPSSAQSAASTSCSSPSTTSCAGSSWAPGCTTARWWAQYSTVQYSTVQYSHNWTMFEQRLHNSSSKYSWRIQNIIQGVENLSDRY